MQLREEFEKAEGWYPAYNSDRTSSQYKDDYIKWLEERIKSVQNESQKIIEVKFLTPQEFTDYTWWKQDLDFETQKFLTKIEDSVDLDPILAHNREGKYYFNGHGHVISFPVNARKMWKVIGKTNDYDYWLKLVLNESWPLLEYDWNKPDWEGIYKSRARLTPWLDFISTGEGEFFTFNAAVNICDYFADFGIRGDRAKKASYYYNSCKVEERDEINEKMG
ncbi:MAG: hypothetical protein LAT84_11530 [Balneolia bacterium]|nr:hypothetical protein [Balneolia bacterium]